MPLSVGIRRAALSTSTQSGPVGQHLEVPDAEAQRAQQHLGGGRPTAEAGQVEAEDGGADEAVHQVVAR
jgi:hypothetical protein